MDPLHKVRLAFVPGFLRTTASTSLLSSSSSCRRCPASKRHVAAAPKTLLKASVAYSEDQPTAMEGMIQDVSHEQVQPWAVRKGIEVGYRLHNLPMIKYIESMFTVHNETANVWTHMLSALVFFGMSIWLFTHYFHVNPIPMVHRTLISLYAFCAGVTFGVSSIYHLFRDQSLQWYNTLRAIDFQSILLLITASYLPAISMAYHFTPTLQQVYLSLVFLFFGVNTLGIQIARKLQLNWLRYTLFAANTFWGIIPTLHVQHLPHPTMIHSTFFLRSAQIMWSCYAIGFLFYALKLPERFRVLRAKMDLMFASHTIWHIMVILGASYWLMFLVKYARLLFGT
mmetsp:Transcript_10191/g.17499  ORF Transcript_10191/g.17499 Transcript_10191/m.17499 type:complete len:340 (+) Transcript_10191:221-1240(+)|eukprot:CAMPEP_0184700314 /NCGR_PEP_ID=MMETSP0313-20130426/11823_1 /TAXON_ID=2792 /ORGANISM="Porphyridium aerugineum, Strain SAG 1380-2" /LENGTH=339 /DNA_ID=CAMNT_0027159913 /DNA_START=185 /DNA_END=1204 /DNA_ORIENTATION=-